MAITDENLNTTMLVQPTGSCNYGNNCGGFFGNGDSWLGILFLIALLNGGWGGYCRASRSQEPHVNGLSKVGGLLHNS